MKTLHRYLAREIAASTGFVFLGLLSLFAFFDLVDEIKDLAHGGYRMRHIVIQVVLSIPNHVYELFPIAALIGTLFALAQLVANSEYTVMRAAGLSVTGQVGSRAIGVLPSCAKSRSADSSITELSIVCSRCNKFLR